MLFEYVPTKLYDDIKNVIWIYKNLYPNAFIIPANPISKPHSDSILTASILRDLLQKHRIYNMEYDEKICVAENKVNSNKIENLNNKFPLFIPTIKTNMHTKESLHSAFLSLKYVNFLSVAIISGDSKEEQTKPLKTYNAIAMLKELAEKDSFFKKMQCICAIDSNISNKTLESFKQKLFFGVRTFITQPFFNMLEYKNFLHQINEYAKNLGFSNISFYCGFMPLFNPTNAENINAKSLGIHIPKEYINEIKVDSINANLELFKELQEIDISMSYINFKDIKTFLTHYKGKKHDC